MRTFYELVLPVLTASLIGPGALRHPPAAGTTLRTELRTYQPAIHTDRMRDYAGPDAIQQVIELTNLERLKAGLPALKRHGNLQESASWMARDMADRRYFNHVDSAQRDIVARLGDFKYDNFRALGENIAMGQRTPQDVVEAWMNSPGHRANILSPNYSEIGVGYVPPADGHGLGYWVQDFGARFESAPVVIGTDAERIRSPHVQVSIHGEDGVEQVRLSNDGVLWTAWEEFRPLRGWNLMPGAGRRTVFVELRRADRVDRVETAVVVEESDQTVRTSLANPGQ